MNAVEHRERLTKERDAQIEALAVNDSAFRAFGDELVRRTAGAIDKDTTSLMWAVALSLWRSRSHDRLDEEIAYLGEKEGRSRFLRYSRQVEKDLWRQAELAAQLDEVLASFEGRAVEFNALGRRGRHGPDGTRILRDMSRLGHEAQRLAAATDGSVDLDLRGIDDALRGAIEREAVAARAERLALRAPPVSPHPDTSCSEAGCSKPRMFFDASGVGYCKRHGNARGLRPHGKIGET